MEWHDNLEKVIGSFNTRPLNGNIRTILLYFNTTNNSLEAPNGNLLSRDIVCSTRITMSQFFSAFEGLFRSQSNRSASNLALLTAADGCRNVRSTSSMNMRLKQWYVKAIDINISYEDGALRCYRDDSNGGDLIVAESLLIWYWRIVLLLLVKLCQHVRWPVVLWPSSHLSDWPPGESN
jgi:hypothetical protein